MVFFYEEIHIESLKLLAQIKYGLPKCYYKIEREEFLENTLALFKEEFSESININAIENISRNIRLQKIAKVWDYIIFLSKSRIKIYIIIILPEIM